MDVPTFSLRFWIILGKQNTRKGSLIRSLTGLGRGNHCEIGLISGQRLHFYAGVRSLNEIDYLPTKYVEDCFKEGANLPLWSYYNLLISLRLDIGKSGYEAEDYIKAFINSGSHIASRCV